MVLFVGIVGGLFLYHETFLPIIKNIAGTAIQQPVDLRPFVLSEQEVRFSTKNLKEKNNNALFGIALPKKTGSLYDRTDIMGYAVAATSDGWLVTSYKTDKIRDAVIITPDRTILPILETHEDPLTGLFIIKIDNTSSNPIQIANADSFVEGDVYYALKFVFEDMAIDTVSLRERQSAHTINPYTSDKVNDRYVGELITNISPGTPIVNKNGLVIGIKGDKNDTIIPSDYIELTVSHFLKNKSFVQRTVLNASCLDISFIAGEKDNLNKLFNGEKNGAYVVSVGGKKQSNLNKNNIQQFDLIKGDIIISIDNILIDKKYDIGEILGTYKKGDIVKIKVKRGDKTLENSITL